MDGKIPAFDFGKQQQAKQKQGETAIALNSSSSDSAQFELIEQLGAEEKLAFIRELLPQLSVLELRSLIELAQQEISDRQRQTATPTAATPITRLLLKKDYTYQSRGLKEPTQYFVYLRRAKPKLDRYIGTLFYIPTGCTLAYSRDPEGRILFNPPHNIFALKDANNPLVNQLVRLICLEPPPPEYTFDKQQDDVPEIHLQLEYLDPKTHQPITKASYAFPACMYEGGKLDRYRWEVSAFDLPAPVLAEPTVEVSSASSSRRILELPAKATTFYLENSADAIAILERMRLWVEWSEKATPHSRWQIIQNKTVHTLQNTSSQRKIFSFFAESDAIGLESSLPVLVRWFQDLGLAVSQTQNPNQYRADELKLARSLFIDMSLPPTDPIVALKQLFHLKFVKSK
ncbi:hypothetical protein H6F67_24440 [Microcoleus sp. FACHB-1515]|uniref:hypothetical protein n=1 Tax=Cyanophyceae TaxID=3028117 RepID=UPI001684254E|nr:hypothetical protein [Microcoleus sp. FACHB-1515]MBD2093000.1 hypothetical protein [Microcoleus sp. FACHB-1515]